MSDIYDRDWEAEDRKRRVIKDGIWQDTAGIGLSDWWQKIDVNRMRRERMERTREQLRKHGLGAVLSFRLANQKYIAATMHHAYLSESQTVGPLSFGSRYVILAQGDEKPSYYEHSDMYLAITQNMPWVEANYSRPAPFRELQIGRAANNLLAEKFVDFLKSELKRKGVLNEPVGIDCYAPELVELLKDAGINVTTEGINVMADAREIKTEDEIECMRVACSIAEAALWAASKAIVPGARESDLVGIMNKAAYEHGGTTLGDAFVALSGPNTSPNLRTFTDRMIRPGDAVFLDAYGVHFMEYQTCYYRTFVCGRAWPELKEAFKKVAYWQRAPLEGIKAGSSTREIAEKFPTAATFNSPDEAAASGNAICHGKGLSHIEAPVVSRGWSIDYPIELKAGHVFAIENQLSDGMGQGVRLEDIVVVRENGYELLSRWPINEIVECPLW